MNPGKTSPFTKGQFQASATRSSSSLASSEPEMSSGVRAMPIVTYPGAFSHHKFYPAVPRSRGRPAAQAQQRSGAAALLLPPRIPAPAKAGRGPRRRRICAVHPGRRPGHVCYCFFINSISTSPLLQDTLRVFPPPSLLTGKLLSPFFISVSMEKSS